MQLSESDTGRTSSWMRFSDQTAYEHALTEQQSIFAARWQWGQLMQLTCSVPGRFAGCCGLCARETEFVFNVGVGGPVNLREELACSRCGLNARTRAVLHLLSDFAPPGDAKRIYLTEQTTFLYKFMRERWPQVVGSEYFDDSLRQRLSQHLSHLIGTDESLRHEDVTALSFDDRSFDAIVSCDVLEHVPDYRGALREFSRVLKPGGRLLLTVPFMDNSEQTTVRALLLADGSIEHLEEPEYHGDPLDPKGVLAYYNFGWDVLDEVRQAGFAEAQWVLPWAPAEALFPGLWTLQAIR